MSLNIVYYIFINDCKKWKVIVEGQLKDFQFCKINYKKWFIHICCQDDHLIEDCKDLIDTFNFKNVIFSQSNDNLFEYPGLKLLYCLSNQSNDIFFYFHSKGMVFNNPGNQRNDFEKTTLRATLYNWEQAMEIFKIKTINKVGLWPSQQGYIWVNFFYIRGGYLTQPPIITSDRWWYETYISLFCNNYFDCYSLVKDKICGIDPDNIKDDSILINQIDCIFD
jgi:hypothetical protein